MSFVLPEQPQNWIPDVGATLVAFPARDGQRVAPGDLFDGIILYCQRDGAAPELLGLPAVSTLYTLELEETELVIMHTLCALPGLEQLVERWAGEFPELELAKWDDPDRSCLVLAEAWAQSLSEQCTRWRMAASVGLRPNRGLSWPEVEPWVQDLVLTALTAAPA